MSVAVSQPSPSRLALVIRATRPPYLPTSVIPALAGALVAVGNDAADWWLLPVVLLATLLVHAGVLEANNLSDIPGDAAAGVRTPAVRIGFRRARLLFLTSLTLTYLVPPVLVATGLFGGWVLLPLATVPLAVAAVRRALAAERSGDAVLEMLAASVAQVHLLGSALLAAGIVLDRV